MIKVKKQLISNCFQLIVKNQIVNKQMQNISFVPFIYTFRFVDKIPLWGVIGFITFGAVLTGLRECLAEIIKVNGVVLNKDPTFRIIIVLFNIIFYILLPFGVMLFTNWKVYQNLKIMLDQMQKDLNDQRLKKPVFKAKFSIFVAITFIISQVSKLIGRQGFYGLYITWHGDGHYLKATYYSMGIKIWDAVAYWILTVLNSALPFYAYKWLEKRSDLQTTTHDAIAIFHSTRKDSTTDPQVVDSTRVTLLP